MALLRWSPFDAFAALERDMQDLMDRMPMRTGVRREPVGEFVWRPRVDVFREKDAVVVRAELPGVDPEKDIEISVEDRVLRIAGQRSFDREIDEEDFYLSERSFGRFQREIMLPQGVDVDQLQAHFENGVLSMTIPLPVEVQPGSRRIPISVGSQTELEAETGD